MVLEEVKRAYDPTTIGRQIAAIAVSGDRRPLLATITAPSLVIHGADDPLFPLACGEDTARVDVGRRYGTRYPTQMYKLVVDGIERVIHKYFKQVKFQY